MTDDATVDAHGSHGDESPASWHDVTIITVQRESAFGLIDVVEAVVLDGLELSMPDDADVTIEALARHGGAQTVTVPILARSITYEHKEPTDA